MMMKVEFNVTLTPGISEEQARKSIEEMLISAPTKGDILVVNNISIEKSVKPKLN